MATEWQYGPYSTKREKERALAGEPSPLLHALGGCLFWGLVWGVLFALLWWW